MPRVVKFYGFFMKCRRMRRTLVTPAAMAASSISPSLPPSPLHFHSFSHSCQSQGLCKETPNELHGRGTKTQFQFQFRFQFGICFSVSNLNFNLQKCIGRKVSGSFCVFVWLAPQQVGENNVVVAVQPLSRQQLHLTLTCDKFRNN